MWVKRRKALRLSKNSGELERAAALSNFQSCPAACTVGTGRFLRRKISFSRAKIVSLQAPRPKNLRFLAETGEGGREAENPLGFQVSPLAKLPTAQIEDLRRGTWPGSLLPRPPACQNFFDKLTSPFREDFYRRDAKTPLKGELSPTDG